MMMMTITMTTTIATTTITRTMIIMTSKVEIFYILPTAPQIVSNKFAQGAVV